MSNSDDPVDLAEFRAQREERERQRRWREARDIGYAPDYGRQVPPPLSPNVSEMVETVRACYAALAHGIAGFQDEVAALADAHKLHPAERGHLSESYREFSAAIEAAGVDIPKGCPGARADDFTEEGAWNARVVNGVADHAKYVYAVGTRDIAALQYRLAELGHTGKLNFEAHEHLQGTHCLAMWETLYCGTLSALHDQRTWDGAWDWYGNTYSDGRQIMVQTRVKDWEELERTWPYNQGMCGDGPILEHPRGSLSQISPVVDPNTEGYSHPWIEIDLEELIEQLGPPPADPLPKPETAVGSQ